MHNIKLPFSTELIAQQPRGNYLTIIVLIMAIILVLFWHPMYKPENYDEITAGVSPKARAYNRFNHKIIVPSGHNYLEFSDDSADDVLMDYVDYDKIVLNASKETTQIGAISEDETAHILMEEAGHEHTVISGDTLLGVLTAYGINQSDVYLLSRQFKELTNLRIGQSLNWEVDGNNQLTELTWTISSRESRHYHREGDKFIESKDLKKGEWKDVVLSGTIKDSFVNSAKAVGLSNNEISQVVKALQWQFDFKKLKNGDRFVVYFSQEMLQDGTKQGSQLLGVHLRNGKDDYYSIAFNGRFYNKNGAGFSKGFLRYPLKKVPRVSSNFNPRRLHPITRRISPHNGVDFAVPIGTQVLAPADGVVVISQYSGSAGNFVVISHDSRHLTRYMHLSKLLVKPGQHVKQGDIIALSGNSGRSTGPHLHYEIHIDKKPVNALKAKLPTSQNLTGKAKSAFAEKSKEIVAKLAF